MSVFANLASSNPLPMELVSKAFHVEPTLSVVLTVAANASPATPTTTESALSVPLELSGAVLLRNAFGFVARTQPTTLKLVLADASKGSDSSMDSASSALPTTSSAVVTV